MGDFLLDGLDSIIECSEEILFLFEVLRVITLEIPIAKVIDFNDSGADLVEEISVV